MVGAPPDAAPILSQTGVRQGDPLGPLLFDCLLQSPLEAALSAAGPEKIVGCAFHDDAALAGQPPDVCTAVQVLKDATQPLGLQMRLPKCAVYSEDSQRAASVAQQLGMRHATDGIVAAGSPIGTDAFVVDYVRQRTDAVRKAVRRLRELEDYLPAQDAFLLLRSSLSSRLIFLQRAVPATAAMPPDHPIRAAHLAAADDITAAALAFARLEGSALLPPAARELMQAPLRHGGFGMYRCGADDLAAAYLSSAALAHKALQAAPSQLRPFASDASRAPLAVTWQSLHTRHPVVAGDAPAQLDEATVITHLPSLQHRLGKHLADTAAAAQLAAAPVELQAVLRSAGCAPAAAWIMAKPTTPRLALDNGAFRAAVRRRLGVPALPPGARHARCACGELARDLGPEHALNCKCVWRLVVNRHDDISRALERALTRAGASAAREPHLSAFGGHPTTAQLARRRPSVDADFDEARGDVLTFLEGEPQIIDVSVTNVLSSSYVAAAAARDGAAAAKRDEVKRASYADRGDSGYKFTPFSVESLGRLGKPALSLLSTVGRMAAERSLGTFSSRQFIDGVLQEIAVILCRYNVRMEHAVAAFVMRPPGREWARSRDVTSCHVGEGL